MADFFSDHFSSDNTVATGTALSLVIDDPRIKAASGIDHAKMRYKRGQVVTDAAASAGDVLRFFTINSGDRIQELLLSKAVDASTTLSGDVGLYNGEGGSLLDLDLFADVGTAPMIDLTLALDRGEVFTGGVLAGQDRGKALWEQHALGAGSDIEDPFRQYDIALTIAAETGIVGITWVMECVYTPAAG